VTHPNLAARVAEALQRFRRAKRKQHCGDATMLRIVRWLIGTMNGALDPSAPKIPPAAEPSQVELGGSCCRWCLFLWWEFYSRGTIGGSINPPVSPGCGRYPGSSGIGRFRRTWCIARRCWFPCRGGNRRSLRRPCICADQAPSFGGSQSSILFPSGSVIQANLPYSESSRMGSISTPSARIAARSASRSSTR
jgi:hypothetical protein